MFVYILFSCSALQPLEKVLYKCRLCYVMLCYVMLCYVMLCYVMLCYVMLCYVMLCYVMLCYVMLCSLTHEVSEKNRQDCLVPTYLK